MSRFLRQQVVVCRIDPTQRAPRGTALSEADFEVEKTVEANGDKPISPLSVAAEPHCVSVMD